MDSDPPELQSGSYIPLTRFLMKKIQIIPELQNSLSLPYVMERIYLTKSEKRTLRRIKECGSKSAYVSSESYYLDVLSLLAKGLVDAVVNYDVVVDVKLTYVGKSYLAANPGLVNPVDWTKVAAIAACRRSCLLCHYMFRHTWICQGQGSRQYMYRRSKKLDA